MIQEGIIRTIEDVLTKEEISRYQDGWKNFGGKYTVISSNKVHNGLPVLSEVYRFEDKQAFRSHIFQDRIRKVDPYFMAGQYLGPFFNPVHRFMVLDQMYQAVSILIKGQSEYNQRAAIEITRDTKYDKPIYFKGHNSLEAIRRSFKLKKGDFDETEIFFFTFYSDDTGEIQSRATMNLFLRPRSYILDINKIKQGDSSAVSSLIRKIEDQDRRHKKLIIPRTSLTTTKEELIEEIRSGELPEEKLQDFFSLWDFGE